MAGETDIQLLVLAHTALAPGNLPLQNLEYLASGNFILGIGPVDGDAAHILSQTLTGIIVDRNDVERIKAVLKEKFTQWSSGGRVAIGDVTPFSRQALTGKLSELLKEEIRD